MWANSTSENQDTSLLLLNCEFKCWLVKCKYLTVYWGYVSLSAVQTLSYELFARVLGLGFKSMPELHSGVVYIISWMLGTASLLLSLHSLYTTNFMPIKQTESLLNWRELKTDALNCKIIQLIHFTDSFLFFLRGKETVFGIRRIFTLFGNSRRTSYFCISNHWCL